MKLLLDTHVILWWQTDDRRLGRGARQAIATADLVWASAVSAWEIAIKISIRRLRLSEPFGLLVQTNEFTELPVTVRHIDALATLPPHHSDPFDRLLIAQATAERATLVTHDRAFEPYGIQTIWA